MLQEFVSSLYVHVPFCPRKCAYCAFYSEAAQGQLVNRYVEALICEMDLAAPALKPETIFFGGGTPSLLNLRQWERIFEAMERQGLLGASEWTVECNPATVSLEKACLLRQWGVNRISMGAQSLDPALLEGLGRAHSREMVFKSFDILRAAGFTNINLDLMFAIPGQTMAVWRQTLAEAIALGSEHLSCYELTYEDDTPLFHQLQAGKLPSDEDLACDMYEELLATAAAHGLSQYEISNFATSPADSADGLPRYACRHNVNYWRGGAYRGLGPSAAGYVRGIRTINCADTLSYCQALENGRRPEQQSEQLLPLARAGELAAFGLRMNAGWPLRQFQQRTGFDLAQEWAKEIQQMTALGFGRLEPDRFRLTAHGLRHADWVGTLFLRS